MVRLAYARMQFCSNSFSPVRTRLDDMRAHEWSIGPTAAAPWRPGSELDGVANFLAERPSWQGRLLGTASAPPGGPLQAEVFGAWLAGVELGLAAGRFDAVYLSLHGACQAEGDPVADLTILRRVRALVGRVPVVATFHPGANLSEEAVLLLDGASVVGGWRSDGDAAARHSLAILERMLAGQFRPVGVLSRLPGLLPSLDAAPLVPEILASEAPQLDRRLVDAGLCAGFPWADSAHAGASALVWTDRDAGLARATAERLIGRLAEASRRRTLWQPAAALKVGRATGRFALLDPADDPLVGGIADTPGLLAAIVDAALPGPAAFGVLHDPQGVAAAREAGIGGTLDWQFGGRRTEAFGPPVPLRATVERLVDAGRSAPDQAGALAVLRHGGLAILLSERRPALIGLDVFVRAGIAPASLSAIALKAGAMPNPALAAAFPEALACDFAGPASPDLLSLPFQDVPKSRRGGD